MFASPAMSLTETLEWARDLDDSAFRWHITLMADDPGFHTDRVRRCLLFVAIERMGLR